MSALPIMWRLQLSSGNDQITLIMIARNKAEPVGAMRGSTVVQNGAWLIRMKSWATCEIPAKLLTAGLPPPMSSLKMMTTQGYWGMKHYIVLTGGIMTEPFTTPELYHYWQWWVGYLIAVLFWIVGLWWSYKLINRKRSRDYCDHGMDYDQPCYQCGRE